MKHRKFNTFKYVLCTGGKIFVNDAQWCHRSKKWPNVQTSPLISDLNSKTEQQKKFQNPKIEIISDLNSNCQQPKPGDRRNSISYKTCWKCRANDERPTGKKTQLLSGTTVEK